MVVPVPVGVIFQVFLHETMRHLMACEQTPCFCSPSAQEQLRVPMEPRKNHQKVMQLSGKHRPPLPPPPIPQGYWPMSSGWKRGYAEDSIRGAGEEEAAAAIQPPPQKQHETGRANHCRFFNFGESTCYLPNCTFAHIDAWSYDARTGKLLRQGDPLFVTHAVMSKMKGVHANALQELREAKRKREPDEEVVEEKTEVKPEETPEEAKGVSSLLLQKWLDEGRMEPLQCDSVFNRDRVTLKLEGHPDKVRFPFEKAIWDTAYGDVSLTMHKKTHVVWSCMLYGSGKGVMQHLQSCLLLGYKLRYELKPLLLQKFNIEFENVLFVTEAALDEWGFRACSHLWSMVFHDIPKVHESRLAGTSKHLIGEGTDPSHLFLKAEAFKSTAGLSIISDVDLVVTSPENLANEIEKYHKPRHPDSKIFPAGSVMVMQRKLSKVVFNEGPVEINKKDWSPHHHEAGQMPLSYCFAFISPTKELADRYQSTMESPAQNQGLLSDQDLLAEVISNKFTLSHHDIIAFPSWWVHWDICEYRAQEVMELNMSYDKKLQPWRAHGKGLLEMIGAFHLSKSFDFLTCADSLETKRTGWMRSMRMSAWSLKKEARVAELQPTGDIPGFH